MTVMNRKILRCSKINNIDYLIIFYYPDILLNFYAEISLEGENADNDRRSQGFY